MGWRLAEEVAWARPERPGPEWWTLMDIAQDARDETRQSMCGQDYLMARGKFSKATLYRRLEALTNAGLLKVVRKSAPGIRAIYEIPPLWITPEQVSAIVRPEQVSAMLRPVSGADGSHGSQTTPERVSKPAATGLTIAETHPVTTTPSLQPPSTSNLPVPGGSLEGSGLSTSAPTGMSQLEKAAWQATESRNRRAEAEAQ